MSEENNTEEELLENNTPEQPETPAEDENETEAQIPVISNASQVEPLTVLELFEHALELLHASNDEDVDGSEYVKLLYQEHFGENYTPEDYNSGIKDERQQAVITEYIRDRLDYVKMQATCLDKQRINKAFKNIFSMVGLDINISGSVEELYDEVFEKRAGQNAFLLEDYEVLKLNRKVCHLYNERSNITELSNLITAMEDMAISIDDDKENPDFKIVNNEQLAQFYYNVSEIYENEANRKSNMPDINKWHYRAMEYKKKALDMTSRNIIMVSNIQNDWKDYADYNPKKITDACERIIDNAEASDRDKYRAHKLCADTIFGLQVVDGFVGKEERIDEVIKHYRAALAYTYHKEDKIDILNNISKAQKRMYPKDYMATRLNIAEMLEGRPRIREYFKISDFAENKSLKAAMLKSCINEFHELPSIENEDRLLYDSIDKKLRALLSGNDKETVKLLDKLKTKYGTASQKNNDMLFPVMSSKGHDYFSK